MDAKEGNGLTGRLIWSLSKNTDTVFCFGECNLTVSNHNQFVACHQMINEDYRANTNEPGHEKTCLMSYANNKCADQPAHPHSLISVFVVRCLDSIITLDSIAKISRL